MKGIKKRFEIYRYTGKMEVSHKLKNKYDSARRGRESGMG
jgi:hypothetical protein